MFKRYPRDEDNRKWFIAHCIRYGAAEPRAKQSQGVVRGRVEGGDPEGEGKEKRCAGKTSVKRADPILRRRQPSLRATRVSVCVTAMPEALRSSDPASLSHRKVRPVTLSIAHRPGGMISFFILTFILFC